jgi:CHASE3 domain sensor protein
MRKNWTFGKKLGVGYAAMVVATLVLSAVAVLAPRSAVENKDRVIDVDSKILLEAQALLTSDMRLSSDTRGYVLPREDKFLQRVHNSRGKFNSTLARVNGMIYTADARGMIDRVRQAGQDYVEESEKIFELARHGATLAVIGDAFEVNLAPARDRIDHQIGTLVEHQRQLLYEAQRRANKQATAVNRFARGSPR